MIPLNYPSSNLNYFYLLGTMKFECEPQWDDYQSMGRDSEMNIPVTDPKRQKY